MAPKFALYYEKNSYEPYVIKENARLHDGLGSRTYASYRHLSDALEYLAKLTDHPVLIAFTAETVD